MLPNSILQKRLEKHMNYIFLCDWLLRHENPATIQEKEISKVKQCYYLQSVMLQFQFCVERCLQGNSREQVSNWIDVSTHYRGEFIE